MKIKQSRLKCWFWSLYYGFRVAGLYCPRNQTFYHPKKDYHEATYLHEYGHHLFYTYKPECKAGGVDPIFDEMVAIYNEFLGGINIDWYLKNRFDNMYKLATTFLLQYLASKKGRKPKIILDKTIDHMYDWYIKHAKPQLTKEII